MRTEHQKIGAVILAGGRGSRMHSDVQKQYMLLGGRPLICYALEAFEKSRAEELVLVAGAGEEDFVRREILAPMGLKKVKAVVAGGKERYHSVYEGLKALADCSIVLIHDGARPLVTEAVIEGAIAGAEEFGACAAAMPVKDTIKEADADGFVAGTPDRSRLWQIQTPQGFSYELIRGAYDRLMQEAQLQRGITDDAMVAERCAGVRVKLTEGSYMNLKVTTPEDLPVAETLLRAREKGIF
ncbi:MAG: 2-C-methyl-D-erythritol 4-phosphate cytidylyltransferase [Eubacteriales bacterium]|nr:2-C-methyl-D-erythritol 4-phosphate cytidylyltransferase [Eubacteriales bacterium]